jgi:hypothetical protein
MDHWALLMIKDQEPQLLQVTSLLSISWRRHPARSPETYIPADYWYCCCAADPASPVSPAPASWPPEPEDLLVPAPRKRVPPGVLTPWAPMPEAPAQRAPMPEAPTQQAPTQRAPIPGVPAQRAPMPGVPTPRAPRQTQMRVPQMRRAQIPMRTRRRRARMRHRRGPARGCLSRCPSLLLRLPEIPRRPRVLRGCRLPGSLQWP